MHGFVPFHFLNNMVVGVSKGYEVKLELVGVGYRAESTGSDFRSGTRFFLTIPIYKFLMRLRF